MARENTFEVPPEKLHFPSEEEKTLQYWRDIDAFQESLRQSQGKPAYNFYDGPPFATGLPHYGHILAGTIKDVVTRYAHQRGYHVERRFGWDCHGLPVEFEIDKKLNIKGKPDVMAMGIDKYNEECRSIVQRYTAEWRRIVERFGRWIDFDNDYKTMDLSFMESCWWVFKTLFDKGLVYRSFRVMPYSTACGTPLSNFEVSQNYKEVSDPSIIVQFKLKDEENSYVLAWTTTPWTLPSNLGLCVNPELTYLQVQSKADGTKWIVGKDRWAWVCSSIKKDAKKDFDVLWEKKGGELKGKAYEPLFDFFKGKALEPAWKIMTDGYVSTEAGTCIVHQAPAFGEDDNRVCLNHGVILKDGTGMVCPLDDNGCYTAEVPDFKGMHVKVADKDIKERLKKEGKLVFNGTEVHNYPHCWRSDTPLIYKAVPSWFIKVEERRENLIASNNQTYWVPAFVKEKRFHNWLSESRDWGVSRNRYWGTPIPLWVSEDFEEIVCIGSVAELEQHAGRKLTDIHRHFIDDIKIPSKKGKGMLRRVDEVFDCWFESGSMPYASKHYPFERKEEFEKAFPAQFIAEGLDQTRGWFYTLMVLSTHLFDKPPFENLIVNGLVLAADGKKMSKRLKNYPDPQEVVNNHGADAVRMYMLNSGVVRAEPLKFKEEGVRDVVKDVFLPWYNAYRFLIQESFRYEGQGKKFQPTAEIVSASTNVMDQWINASLHGLMQFVREEMEAYRLYTVVPRLVQFLEDLTNWYVRLNRDRMRGGNGLDEAFTSLCTLYMVLLNVTVCLAPVIPFITEHIYQNLSKALPDGHPMKAKSVHFVMIPEPDLKVINADITQAVSRMQNVVELGRTCRERRKVGLKMPLKTMTIMNKDEGFMKDVKSLQKYIEEELNVMEVVYTAEAKLSLTGTLNFRALGKRLGKDMKKVQDAVKELTQEQLAAFESSGKITIAGHDFEGDDLQLSRKLKDLDNPNLDVNGDDATQVVLDFTEDEDLKLMAVSRDIVNKVQKMRKDTKLQQDDPVDMWAEVKQGKKSNGALGKALKTRIEYIQKLLRRDLFDASLLQGHEVVVNQETFDMSGGDNLVVTITVRGPHFNAKALQDLTKKDATAEAVCRQYLQTFDLQKFSDLCKKGSVKVNCGGKSFEMKHKEHFSLGPSEAPWLKK
eukprot:TRINITY_DN13637_c0_g1_i1.p1 TRINITY_DN13637_c0_g1~~TRINITY_DN13637_c0_g1_i1.p1  ORF type:complete len:1154 (+),score=333.83 TRINITY_DN13637_c0_g1_i1:204-3665(+)